MTKRELLDLRFCDLGLTLSGTWVEPIIERVREELADRGLRVKPHFWLSDEWFSPDGVPGVAVPFYLAHPRLMRLEKSEIYEVEGGTQRTCLKLLRHEVGHAVDHAFRLARRRTWQRTFGKASQPYPEYYRPNPASRNFVLHLDGWYAQSHPSEDFAETFAVWLTPRARWQKRYRSWPRALEKLEYVDSLMRELAGRAPLVKSRAVENPLHKLKQTLREHYAEKKAHYEVDVPSIYDRDLKRLFSSDPKHKYQESAVSFLRRHRRDIRRSVAKWTGQYEFTTDQVLKEMIARAGELKLRAVGPEWQLVTDFTILLTVKTMDHLYRERHWIPV